jgi:hypothetical protein
MATVAEALKHRRAKLDLLEHDNNSSWGMPTAADMNSSCWGMTIGAKS